MALREGSSPSRWFGLALPLALLSTPGSSGVGNLSCASGPYVVGRALPILPAQSADQPDWDRLDRLTQLARETEIEARDWKFVARQLKARATNDFGNVSLYDLYWLGTAWWSFHQPVRHLNYPDWAPIARRDPNIALRHPEGGNCESSSNGHATLLTFLGVPSRPVYGKLLPSGEGHVWTVSDVDGVPMAADVHVARATADTRRWNLPWRPSPAQVQTTASYADALRFAALHRPENPELNPINLQ